MQHVAARVHKELGYSLHVGPSSIGTTESGLGVFVRGNVPVSCLS